MKTLKHFLIKHGTLVSLCVLIAVITVLNPKFLTIYNILNIFRQAANTGLIALGMTFVIITGGIDLSVGSVLGLTGMIMGLLLNAGMPEAAVLPLIVLAGIILGIINGVLVAAVNLQPFIATLATMTMYRGLTMIISNGIPAMDITLNAPFLNFCAQGRIFGIPVPMIILIGFLLILMVVLQNTLFGRYVYAIGGNEEAARLSSVPVTRVKIAVYAVSGLLSACAGMVLCSRLSSAQPTAGTGFELDAIAAVVIGGTGLSGGKGKITGTFLGILVIGVLNNGLNIIGVSPFYQQFIKGLVILFAVIPDRKKSVR